MKLQTVTYEFVQARHVFEAISPGISDALLGRPWLIYDYADKAWYWFKDFVAVHRGDKTLLDVVEERMSDKLSDKVTDKATTPIANQVYAMHQRILEKYDDPLPTAKPRTQKRGWITKPGRYDIVVVFHDANRAGPHIDVHIDALSVIYRVKPDLYSQLKYRGGYLTQNSKKLLLDHIKAEINNKSRVPQNLDHDADEARFGWVGGDREGKNYGDGPTRQVVAEFQADVYKAHKDGPVEFYCPDLNPHRPMYIHQLYGGDDKRAPILVWGNKKHNPPKLEEKLHLRLTHPEKLPTLDAKADMTTSTAKYDGSSCYVVITPKGTTVWGPRISKRTSEAIEYTHKLGGIAEITSDETIVAMGELLFLPKSRERKYLSSSEGAGILNSAALLPEDVKAEIRLYRVDKIGRKRYTDQNFWENRMLQEQIAKIDPKGRLKVVELMGPEKARQRGFEGVVVVPTEVLKGLTLNQAVKLAEDDQSESSFIEERDDGRFDVRRSASVNQGFKVKWWTDPHDWRIDKVAFTKGERGGVAGVIECTSLESGKKFKLGPGQVGTRDLCAQMTKNPELFEGAVLKVQSRHGHEGRAAKAIGIHTDKGFAPF